MAEPKTKLTKASANKFIDTLPDPQVRADCRVLVKLMSEASGAKPQMWGASIVGFGRYKYKGASCEGEWPIIGFSPRKQNLSLYLAMYAFDEQTELLAKLGKHSLGKGCLYIKRLSDIDLTTLKKIIKFSVNRHKKRPEYSKS